MSGEQGVDMSNRMMAFTSASILVFLDLGCEETSATPESGSTPATTRIGDEPDTDLDEEWLDSVESACTAHCVTLATCFEYDTGTCIDNCSTWHVESDPLCREPLELLHWCISQLSCAEIEEYWAGDPGGSESYPCRDLDRRVLLWCG